MAQFAATSTTSAAGSTPGQVLITSGTSAGNGGNLLRLASGSVSLAGTLSSPRTQSSSSGGPGSSCCEGGRPLVPDPLTGQPVCGCQLESSSASASAAMLLGLPRLTSTTTPSIGVHNSGMPAVGLGLGLGLYNPYAAGPEQAFLTSDQSPFYAAASAGHDLKETLALNGGPAAAGWPYPASMYYPYDPALAAAAYPFAGYGMDLNGARRKNATRETTATLKAWLSEHKKNPYPTKGEKIMLAIITKMTLTQVSTWFANARRRLKKENKMTWEPKNRNDDDDDDDSDAMDNEDTNKEKHSSSERSINGDLDRPSRDWVSASSAKSPATSDDGDRDREDLSHRQIDSDNIDVESDEEELDLLSSDSCLSSADVRTEMTDPSVTTTTGQSQPLTTHLQPSCSSSSSSTTPSHTTTATTTSKPKIWSLADMANANRNVTDASHVSHNVSSPAFPSPFGPLSQAFNLRNSPFIPTSTPSGGGKIFPSLPRLGSTSFGLESSPYGRPNFYRYPAGNSTTAVPLLSDPRLYNVRLPMTSASDSILAYNKLISAANHISPSHKVNSTNGLPTSPVENLEKLANLTATTNRNDMKSVTGNS